MKDNNDMLHGGKLKPEFYQSWANYFTKFIRAYEGEGIPIWGISIQNEPMATQKWESCIYSAEEERDFLKKYLGPTLKREGLSSRKVIAWDHNRDLIYQRASTILRDPEAAKFVWGIGFHWYEPWSGGEPMFDNVRLVNETFPDKNLIFTEGCVDSFDAQKISEWKFGEQYGRSMINDFNNGTVGWTDWNVLLDEQGGPNHVGNFCFAPCSCKYKNRRADVSQFVLLYRTLFEIRSAWCKANREFSKSQSTSLDCVSKPGWPSSSGGDEPKRKECIRTFCGSTETLLR
jgi:glucosylceramidase